MVKTCFSPFIMKRVLGICIRFSASTDLSDRTEQKWRMIGVTAENERGGGTNIQGLLDRGQYVESHSVLHSKQRLLLRGF